MGTSGGCGIFELKLVTTTGIVVIEVITDAGNNGSEILNKIGLVDVGLGLSTAVVDGVVSDTEVVEAESGEVDWVVFGTLIVTHELSKVQITTAETPKAKNLIFTITSSLQAVCPSMNLYRYN